MLKKERKKVLGLNFGLNITMLLIELMSLPRQNKNQESERLMNQKT
jgi:hypothetical protein